MMTELHDRRWLRFDLQRRVMRPAARDRVSAGIARSRRQPARAVGREAAMAKDPREIGLVNRGQVLPPEQCEDLRSTEAV